MNRANTMQESHSIACAMQVVTIKTSLVSNAQLEVAERTDLRCSLPKLREVRQALARLRWQSCGNYPHIRPARGAPQPHTVFCASYISMGWKKERGSERNVSLPPWNSVPQWRVLGQRAEERTAPAGPRRHLKSHFESFSIFSNVAPYPVKTVTRGKEASSYARFPL